MYCQGLQGVVNNYRMLHSGSKGFSKSALREQKKLQGAESCKKLPTAASSCRELHIVTNWCQMLAGSSEGV